MLYCVCLCLFFCFFFCITERERKCMKRSTHTIISHLKWRHHMFSVYFELYWCSFLSLPFIYIFFSFSLCINTSYFVSLSLSLSIFLFLIFTLCFDLTQFVCLSPFNFSLGSCYSISFFVHSFLISSTLSIRSVLVCSPAPTFTPHTKFDP